LAVVIDQDCASLVATEGKFPVLVKWLLDKGKIGTSRELRKRYERYPNFLEDIYDILDDVGRNIRLSPEMEDKLEQEVESIQSLCKNKRDDFIVAMMRLAGFRLIVSNDSALIDDIRNEKLFNNPRGQCYCRRSKEEGRGQYRISEHNSSRSDKLLKDLGHCGD